MKVAVASMGTAPEALVGIRFGMCSQFLVFDLDTMEYVVVSVPPRALPAGHVSLEAIRALAHHGVSAVITGNIQPICRETLFDLGIEVIDGVERMTVSEAIERYRAGGLAAPESRSGWLTWIAVVSAGEGPDARLATDFGECAVFTLVEPQTKEWKTVRVQPDGPERKLNVSGVRAVVQNGASVVITPHLSPACCLALQALAVAAYLAPEGVTVREAVEMYERGELTEAALHE